MKIAPSSHNYLTTVGSGTGVKRGRCCSSVNLARRLALDTHHNAFARARGEENRALRSDLGDPPALGNACIPRRYQDRTLIGTRRQLSELKELATHVPHDEPRRRIDRGKRIRC